MAVFRELDIEWGGKTYSVTPSNRLLRKIEGEGISIAHMMARIGEGKPPVSETCFVMEALLRSAGAEVTEDEIYDDVMTALGNGDDQAFANMAQSIVTAISPKGMTGKKPEGQPAKPRPKGKAKSRK